MYNKFHISSAEVRQHQRYEHFKLFVLRLKPYFSYKRKLIFISFLRTKFTQNFVMIQFCCPERINFSTNAMWVTALAQPTRSAHIFLLQLFDQTDFSVCITHLERVVYFVWFCKATNAKMCRNNLWAKETPIEETSKRCNGFQNSANCVIFLFKYRFRTIQTELPQKQIYIIRMRTQLQRLKKLTSA